MERKFGNAAALRHQVVTSSQELRALESKLKACALTCYNRAAMAEKEVHTKLMNIGEREYAGLVKELDHEEKLSASLTLADQEVKMLKTQRVLQEQIAEKAADKAKAEAENVIEMMAEVDENKLMEKEKKEQWEKRQASQENTRLALQKQTELRKLLEEEDKLQDRNISRCAEEYNLRIELQKEMERQKAEMQRLQHQQQEVALIHKLEKQQMEKDVIQDTRLELEILQKSAQEKKFTEEKEKHREEARLSLIRGLDDQVKYKKEQEAKEQKKDDEYRKLVLTTPNTCAEQVHNVMSQANLLYNFLAQHTIVMHYTTKLLEVMAEESKLDQLVAGARRRRQLDHRQLVEHLLQERRVLRAKLMNQHQLHNQEELAYNQLRKSILEEEEKQLLLKYAPHLMPYFSPELHARLRQLL
ncbi:meiosis-specific nuclear structural protein 1-like isoform X2 [Portunus trituberculatus]|uniref:meiosis-specific nuclear structural protein 1-like isoform X2 n=1 Tax=Portunus trituberculatus TaxID=210409 RepID=UPI001E1CBF2F|nr:meiosis-specific nuclear structural protein 1-like isoform X2 [Portunus trituberculatus]